LDSEGKLNFGTGLWSLKRIVTLFGKVPFSEYFNTKKMVDNVLDLNKEAGFVFYFSA